MPRVYFVLAILCVLGCKSTSSNDSSLADSVNPMFMPVDDSKLAGRTLNCAMSDETASPWYAFAIQFKSESSAMVETRRSAFFGSEEFPAVTPVPELADALVKRDGDRIDVISPIFSDTKAVLLEHAEGYEGSFTFAPDSDPGTPQGQRVTVECQFARASQAVMAAAKPDTPPLVCSMMDADAKPWFRFTIGFESGETVSVKVQQFSEFGAAEQPPHAVMTGWESATFSEQMDQLIVESANFAEHGFAELTKKGAGFAGQFIFSDSGPEPLQHGAVNVTCAH